MDRQRVVGDMPDDETSYGQNSIRGLPLDSLSIFQLASQDLSGSVMERQTRDVCGSGQRYCEVISI